MPVRYELDSGLARVTLARAEKRNALSIEMVEQLHDALTRAVDDGAGVVLLGAEGPTFCAGMDLKTVDVASATTAERFAKALGGVYHRLLTLPLPLLCAVDGRVLGGGVGIAAAGDLVWVGPHALYTLSETRLGLVPALVSVVLRRRLAPARVAGMALGGPPIQAREALDCGLADRVAQTSAIEEAELTARELLRDRSADANSRTKAFISSEANVGLQDELVRAREAFCEAVKTSAARRGLEAFLLKRSVRWDEKEG